MRNVLVDLANEPADRWPHELLKPPCIHELIQAAQAVGGEGAG